MNVVEFGAEGQVIEWREHALSGLMKELGEQHLELEPILHPAGNWAARQLAGIEIDRDGMRWDWGAWESVRIVARGPGEEITQASRTAGESNVISWNTPPAPYGALGGGYFDSLELTPVDRGNVAGVTRRIERPANADSGIASFRFFDQRHWKVIRVRLEKQSSLWREIGVWRLQLGGYGYLTKGQELKFNQDGYVDAAVNDFRGVVAVVGATEANERRLLACRWFADLDGSLRSLSDEAEARMIREHLGITTAEAEGNEPKELTAWLNQWPHHSREKLRHIYRRSLSLSSMPPQLAWQMVKQNPTGAQRASALRLAGLPGDTPFDQLAEELKDDENFARMIDRAGDGDLPNVEPAPQPAGVAELDQTRPLVFKATSGVHTAASEGGRIELLEAPDGVKLETESKCDWITIENVATRTVFYSVTKNTGKDWRAGEISVNGALFNVIQKGAES
jgi:hypothetical protein